MFHRLLVLSILLCAFLVSHPCGATEPTPHVKPPQPLVLEPNFSAEFLVYKHERDGLAAMKTTLAIVDAGVAFGVLATTEDRYTQGVLAVTSLRALDVVWEVSLLVGRHTLVDAEIKTRADIRRMRSKWQRSALVSALLNTTVGSLASIGWLTIKDEFWKGVFTGISFQTAHSVAEQLVEAFVMRPWTED